MSDPVPHLPPHLEGQSSSWLSKATSASILGHPMVWTAMTAVFILIGYLWLQYYAKPLSERLGPSHDGSEQIGGKSGSSWSPDIYREVKTEEMMAITRQADDLRADNYRETIDLENRIQPLLRQAREYLDQQAYTGVSHQNAWQAYKSILLIDPDHKLAQSGLAQIIGLLQGNAEYAVEQQQYEEAERWLGELDSIEADASFQQQMRHQIAERIALEVAMFEEEQRIEERNQLRDAALLDASAAMQMEPSELRVAYDLYMRAQELDDQSEEAIAGLKKIFDTRAMLASQAIDLNDFQEAQKQIKRLEETEAPDTIITPLRNKLAAARTKLELEAEAAAKAKAVATAQHATDETIEQPKADSSDQNTETENDSLPKPEPATPAPSPDIDTNTGAEPILESEIKLVPVSPVTERVEVSSVEVETDQPQGAQAVSQSGESTSRQTSPPTRAQQLSAGINAYYAGNYNKAFTHLHPLAEANSPRAQFRLGVMYYQGRTVVKNEDLARQWIARALPAILRAAQKGQAWAQADLGTAYELGIGVKKDLQNAASWYQKAARQGYVGGQTNLGVLYGTGVGVKYDRQAALYWLRKAAEQGDKVAQDNLKILNAR